MSVAASMSVGLAGCAMIDELRGENYLEIDDLLVSGPHDFDGVEKLEASPTVRHSGRATMSNTMSIELGGTVVDEESIESDTRGTGGSPGTIRIPTTDLSAGTYEVVLRLGEFESEASERVDID